MLAVAGDSAAGKSTLTTGLAAALGPQRCVVISADDYRRYDRSQRRAVPLTAQHPDCTHLDILDQHLQLLATGQSVLKPVYDHVAGTLLRPELVAPREYVIVAGLLPLHNKLARACFDITVFVDPPEDIRMDWKMRRDTAIRGYTAAQVRSEATAAHGDSERYVRPQQAHADIVVRFAPVAGRDDPPDTPLSAELVLRPTIRQPDLTEILQPEVTRTMHLRLARENNGRPVDSLHVHGYTGTEENAAAEKMIWEALGDPRTAIPDSLGVITPGRRSTPLAITQMILLHYLTDGLR
ncbi:MAG: phosphoribulokinase [Actinobacteria bacterium]|nr:phosphoribulokinase [Actinomycetota bacterium]